MLKLIILITVLTASPEGEAWEYQMKQYPCTAEYAFSEGHVYLVKDDVPYLYPRIPFACFATYGNGWALMYWREGFSFGYLCSNFENCKAVQIGLCLLVPYRFDFVLKKGGIV